MAGYVVGRRRGPAIRYGGENQDAYNARQRQVKVPPPEEDEDDVPEEAPKKKVWAHLSHKDIVWTADFEEELSLDCALVIHLLTRKLKTYSEFNQGLCLGFIAEMRKFLSAYGKEKKLIVRATNTGILPRNKGMGTFLRIEFQTAYEGEVQECALPGGFRSMCQEAISSAPRPRNNFLFPENAKRR